MPHSKELQHERAAILLQTLNSVFGAKCQHRFKPLHKDPKVLEPCCLGREVTIVVIAPVQGAAAKAYLDKEVVIHHHQSIAVCLAKKTQMLRRHDTFSDKATNGMLDRARPWYISGRVLHSFLILQLTPRIGRAFS